MATPIEIENVINNDPYIREMLERYLFTKFGEDNIISLDNAMQYYQYPIAITIIPEIINEIITTNFKKELAYNVARMNDFSYENNFADVKPLVEANNSFDKCLTDSVFKAAIVYAQSVNIKTLKPFETIVNECEHTFANLENSKGIKENVKKITYVKGRDFYNLLILAIDNIFTLDGKKDMRLYIESYIKDDAPILNDETIKINPIYFVSAIAITSRPYDTLSELLEMYSIVRTEQMIERIVDETSQYLGAEYKNLTKFKSYFNKVSPSPSSTVEQKDALVYALVVDKLCNGRTLLSSLMHINILLNKEFDNLTKPLLIQKQSDILFEKAYIFPLLRGENEEKSIISNWDSLSSKFKSLIPALNLLPRIKYSNAGVHREILNFKPNSLPGTGIIFFNIYDEWYLPRKKVIDEENKRLKEIEDARKKEAAAKRKESAAQRKQKMAIISNSEAGPSNIENQVVNILDNANVRRVTRSMNRQAQPENLRSAIAEQALETAQRLDGLLNIINNQEEAQIQVPLDIDPPNLSL